MRGGGRSRASPRTDAKVTSWSSHYSRLDGRPLRHIVTRDAASRVGGPGTRPTAAWPSPGPCRAAPPAAGQPGAGAGGSHASPVAQSRGAMHGYNKYKAGMRCQARGAGALPGGRAPRRPPAPPAPAAGAVPAPAPRRPAACCAAPSLGLGLRRVPLLHNDHRRLHMMHHIVGHAAQPNEAHDGPAGEAMGGKARVCAGGRGGRQPRPAARCAAAAAGRPWTAARPAAPRRRGRPALASCRARAPPPSAAALPSSVPSPTSGPRSPLPAAHAAGPQHNQVAAVLLAVVDQGLAHVCGAGGCVHSSVCRQRPPCLPRRCPASKPPPRAAAPSRQPGQCSLTGGPALGRQRLEENLRAVHLQGRGTGLADRVSMAALARLAVHAGWLAGHREQGPAGRRGPPGSGVSTAHGPALPGRGNRTLTAAASTALLTVSRA